MKKLCCLIIVALAVLTAAPAVAPVAVAAEPRGHREKEFVEFVVGPFEHEKYAHEEAHRLHERGFHTHVFHVRYLGWHVKAWREE